MIQIEGLLPSVAVGYLLTIVIETSVLMVGLQPKHSFNKKLAAGFGLTAFTYPFVCFVFPYLMPLGSPQSVLYLPVAETFAPVAECAVFWLLFAGRPSFRDRGTWRDMLAIVAANLASFLLGELMKNCGLIAFVN